MFKRFMMLAVLSTAATVATAADVGVSITVAEPGMYGRIDIGNFPQPQVIYTKPIVVQRVPAPAGVVVQPIYMRVPPGHAKHWRKHCHEYNACGQPVYFVQEKWYNDVYVPRHAERRGPPDEARGRGDHEHGHEHGHGRGRDH